MNEHGFVRQVHRRLPHDLHVWKINARYVRGVPDAWYSGPAGDVWVEYKYLQRTPTKRFTPDVTALQSKWLSHRHEEGRNVAVVVGCPAGAVILTDHEWTGQVATPDAWKTPQEVAEWIKTQTRSMPT